MRHLVKHIILFYLLLSLSDCAAQVTPPLLRKITVADGLPQGYISGMVQDSRGYIWVGTRNGLARYDGRKFKVFHYSPSDKTGLSSGIISYLWLDTKNRLWILYESGALDVFDTRTEEVLKLTAKKEFSMLSGFFKRGRSIVDDASGQHWILTNTGQLYVIDAQLSKLEPVNLMDPVQGVALSGNTIILTTDKEFLFLNLKKTITDRISIPNALKNIPRDIFVARDNSVLVRKNGELVLLDHQRILIYQPKNKVFKQISLAKHGHVYQRISPTIIDDHDTIYFELDGKKILDTSNSIRLLNPINGIPLLIDRSGVLWTGTGGDGIEQYDLRMNHLHSTTMKTGFHTEILEEAGVTDTRVKRFIDTISGYGWRWLYTKEQTLWVAQAEPGSHVKDVFYMDRNKKVAYPEWNLKGKLPNSVGIYAMTEDPSGNIWGVGRDMGLYAFDSKSNSINFKYQIPFDIGNPFINQITGLVADNGGFWISSTSGLFHYTIKGGKTERYFVDLRAVAILTDPIRKDILWVGTSYGGLLRLNKKTWKCREFTIRNGLPTNTISAMQYDDNGNLWCSTNRGIFSFDTKTFQARSHNIQGDKKLTEFSRQHYFKFDDGRLAFGGGSGYVIFDPRLILADQYHPETLITSIAVNNTELAAKDRIAGTINNIEILNLPYDKNFITIEFSAIEYNIPEKLNYRYRLKGLDNDWLYSGNTNQAKYTTIPPGNYVFYVNASNTAGEWSDKITTVKINIASPFWLTWWFISIIIIIVTLLLYFGIRRKILQTRKRDFQQLTFERKAMQLEARALRSQMNPHFIFNCLNSIKSLIHSQQNKEAALYLTTFAQLLRNQLNNNLLEISLHDEINTCKLYLKLECLRFGEKLDYEFNIDPSVDCHNIKIPALLLQPFIENAILHGLLALPEGGKITVSVFKNEDTIYCKIDDNGVGRNAEVKDTNHISKGMELVQGRLDLYNKMHEQNAHIEIIDKTDDFMPVGTLVVITLNF